jgi:hypothetical protein
MIPAFADFEFGGPRLPEALDHQAEIAIAEFGVEHAAHCVPLGGPEIQQAVVVLARHGVLRVVKVEDAGAVLED